MKEVEIEMSGTSPVVVFLPFWFLSILLLLLFFFLLIYSTSFYFLRFSTNIIWDQGLFVESPSFCFLFLLLFVFFFCDSCGRFWVSSSLCSFIFSWRWVLMEKIRSGALVMMVVVTIRRRRLIILPPSSLSVR